MFSAITHAARQLGGLTDASTAVTVAAALAGLGKAELAVRAADTALRRIGQVEPGRIGRGQPLEELAPVLARLGQHDHLIQALEQTAGIESENERAYARAAIYTALAQIGYVDYLDRAVQDVAAVRDTDVRVAVLNRLVEANLKAERYDQALLIWRAALADAQHVGRWRVLHVIQSGGPLIRATGGAQVIWDICQLIIHVDGWWRET